MNECLGHFYYHNGILKDTQSFDDSFLSSPHYIYEVFRVIEGVALFLEDHLERLEETCRLAKHCPGFDSSELYKQVVLLIDKNRLETGNIKVVMRKTNDGMPELMVYITEHQYPTTLQYTRGVDLLLFKAERPNPNAKVMDVKLRNATNYVKQQKEVYETLLVNAEGCITEGSRSNVFFIRQGKVITPPVDEVLPGITRKYVMEVSRASGLEVVEEKVPARSLVVMEALFISGTSRKVLPVRKVDDLDFDPHHPLMQMIREAFDLRVADYIRMHKKSFS